MHAIPDPLPSREVNDAWVESELQGDGNAEFYGGMQSFSRIAVNARPEKRLAVFPRMLREALAWGDRHGMERQGIVEWFNKIARQNGMVTDYGNDEVQRLITETLTPADMGVQISTPGVREVPSPAGPEDYGAAIEPTPTGAEQKSALTIHAAVYTPGDPARLRRRAWLYGGHYIRRYPSTTIGRPGQGKTALALFELLNMTVGRSIGDGVERAPLRCWYIGEDPRDELELRLGAACAHWGITAADLGGRLFVNSTHELPPLRIAEQGGRGAVVNSAAVEALKARIIAEKIDVLIIDPLIKFHGVPESDPSAMEVVVRALSELANDTNISVEMLHHTRKPPPGTSAAATVDDGRGASSIIGAVRSARVVNAMTSAEAERAGIAEADRWRYFRVDSGKANMAPPEVARWYQHVSHILPCGESVGVVAPWQFPDAFAGFSANDLPKVRELARSGAYRADTRSPQWFGRAVADLIGADADDKHDRARIGHMIKTWLKTKVLDIETRPDEQRKDRQFIVPGTYRDEE